MELREGMQVYCDLHHESKKYTITSLRKKDMGWAIVKGDDGDEFYWPIRSCFPVETTKLPTKEYQEKINKLF